jgi:MFS family permease
MTGMTDNPAADAVLPAAAGNRGPRWFGRAVGGIGAASFLSDVGYEVPTALLPSFLTSVLGAPASALGLIEGTSEALSGMARFGDGALADDPGRRRRVAVGGYATTAVLSSAIGVAVAPWQAGVFRAAAWTARGLRVPARNALLADFVPAEAYGRAYGFERAMDNLGAITGPLLAIGLIAVMSIRRPCTSLSSRGCCRRRRSCTSSGARPRPVSCGGRRSGCWPGSSPAET